MTNIQKFKVTLYNKGRKFTTFSNFPESEVFTGETKKWSRVIFLLHGFPDNNSTFDKIWPVLLNSFPKNRKVLLLAPLMRGYEKSSQGKDRENSVTDLAQDVKAWIQEVNKDNSPVHLVGHDWGAIATFKAASLYPDLITSIICLAIPYIHNIKPWELIWHSPEQLYLSSYMLTMQSSWFYRKKFSQNGDEDYLGLLWSYWSPTWSYENEEIEDVRKTLQQPGVLDSATAYYRCMFAPLNFSGRRWKVDFDKVPTLLIGGERDQCMSKSLYKLEMTKLKDDSNADVKLLTNLGHFLHREDPQKVGDLIVEWIAKHP